VKNPTPAPARSGLAFRAATLDDASFSADLETALRPDEPEDPALVRHKWQSESPDWTSERYVIVSEAANIGFAWHRHPPWSEDEKRHGRLTADILPSLRTRDRLAEAYAFIEERATVTGAAIYAADAREDDSFMIEFVTSRGYREDRRSKGWELDLAVRRDHLLAMADASRARMRDQGIELQTLAEDRDPEKYRKIWRLSEEAALDVPTTIPHVPEPFAIFMKWFDSPGLREDRFWIARKGDEILGLSVLSYPPTRGNVWTDWTATARAARNRGVARAVKLETVAQAVGLGVPRVRTENDGKNDPILHLNEEMGYARIPGWIQFLKAA
jgi:mycothiol synthase